MIFLLFYFHKHTIFNKHISVEDLHKIIQKMVKMTVSLLVWLEHSTVYLKVFEQN